MLLAWATRNYGGPRPLNGHKIANMAIYITNLVDCWPCHNRNKLLQQQQQQHSGSSTAEAVAAAAATPVIVNNIRELCIYIEFKNIYETCWSNKYMYSSLEMIYNSFKIYFGENN